jgi:PAS domain S-box-containing protein
MFKALKVLMLEDDPVDAHLVRSALQPHAHIVWVDRLSHAVARLREDSFDAILVDLNVPDSRGLATVHAITKAGGQTPIVVLTGEDDTATALRALAEGADDYLIKGSDQHPAILRSLNYAVQRRRYVRALKESDARWRTVIASALDAVVGMDIYGRITDWNGRAASMFGYDEHEVIGQPLADLIIPERLRERHHEGFRRFIETGVAKALDRRFEVTALRRDGTEFPIELSITAIPMPDGLLFNAFIADISERRRADEARVVAENKFRALVEHSADGIALLDESGTVLYASPAVASILGYPVAEFIGTNVFTLIHPSDLPRARDRFQATLAGEAATVVPELRYRHREGTWRYLNVVRSNRLHDAAVRAVVVNYRDMTQVRASLDALDALQGQHEVILNSLVSGVHGIDTEGLITFENPAAARMLGWDAAALVGLPAHETIHHTLADKSPHDHSGCPIHATLRDGLVRDVQDDVFWRRDGTSFHVAYTAAPTRDRDGNIIGAVVTFRDVTKHREMEAQIEQARRVTSLGRVAASVAHEFNNVLMCIQPSGELLRRKLPADEGAQTAVQRILDGVKRGRQITSQILRFTSPAEPRRESLDLGRWVANFVEEVKPMLGTRTLHVDVHDGIIVHVDSNQLHQIVLNLVSNARDATTSRDTVTIGVRSAATVECLAQGLPDASRFVTLFVSDNGKGVPPEIAARIFEPLFTTKRSGGTGLGLAVAKQIAERHDGTIIIDSPPGCGATFHVVLPAAANSASERTQEHS